MSADSPTDTTQRTTFRLDVQGIRALAVLLVIVHHLAPGRLTGGYIGVDVFFVVSGYLITGLLLREAERDGRISLAGFYARRARRILPAATVVIVATVVASVLTLALLRAQTVIVDALWATFFAANIRLGLTGTDYFAQGQPPSPLRHYWSLAVEEQFYLAWPLLVLGCAVWVHRRGRRGRSLRASLGLLLGGVVVASLAWSTWATFDSPATAYFSTFTRAHELAIGAACALLPRSLRLTGAVRRTLAWLGLGVIAVTALRFTVDTPFPGVAALLPVLGTAALLVAGDGGHERSSAVTRTLSTPPLVRVGDWSYSLYLWHWPVIVLLRSNLGPERFSSLPVRLSTLALIVALSWATFRWVETPFRSGRTWRPAPRALAIYPASVALVVVTAVAGTQLVSYRLGEWSDDPAITVADYRAAALGDDGYVALVRASALAAREGREVPSDLTPGLLGLREQTASVGDCDYRTGTRDLCPLGDPDADRTIVVLGDSHARALSPAIEELGRTRGYRVHVLVYSGCSAIGLVQVERDTGRPWQECQEFKSWAADTVSALAPDLVVVSTAAGKMVDPDSGETVTVSDRRYVDVLEDGWSTMFADLEQRADEVVVVGNTPKLPREPGVCLSQGDPDLGDCAFAPGSHAADEARASFRAARGAGAGAVDASEWFCAEDVCPAVVGSYITMRDTEHMTPDYSRWLATPLGDALGLHS